MGRLLYHGRQIRRAPVAPYWATSDREYAELFGSYIYEVFPPYPVLDLRSLGIDTTSEELEEKLEDAGVDVEDVDLGFDGDDEEPSDEMHQRLVGTGGRGVSALARAIKDAGYAAICIRECTYGYGEADSFLILVE